MHIQSYNVIQLIKEGATTDMVNSLYSLKYIRQ